MALNISAIKDFHADVCFELAATEDAAAGCAHKGPRHCRRSSALDWLGRDARQRAKPHSDALVHSRRRSCQQSMQAHLHLSIGSSTFTVKPKKTMPTWSDVNANLTEFDRAGLLGLVQDLYAADKSNQAFLHARFGLGGDVLAPYKARIDRWLWPDVARNQWTSVATAKKAICLIGCVSPC